MLTIRAMRGGKGYRNGTWSTPIIIIKADKLRGSGWDKPRRNLGSGARYARSSLRQYVKAVDPNSGDFLRVRQSADRVAEDGTTLAKARAARRSQRKPLCGNVVAALYHHDTSRGLSARIGSFKDREEWNAFAHLTRQALFAMVLPRPSIHSGFPTKLRGQPE